MGIEKLVNNHIQFSSTNSEPNICACPLLFLLGLNSSLDLHLCTPKLFIRFKCEFKGENIERRSKDTLPNS